MMNHFNYLVHLEPDGPVFVYQTPQEVFSLLKKEGYVSILRYNDRKTGAAYAEKAKEYGLSTAKQESLPVFVDSGVAGEDCFTESEDYWAENNMLDLFYYPDRMPYIEKIMA